MWNNDHLVLKGWTWLDSEGNKHGVRIMGVLQRIALCYFFASVLVYYLKPKGAFYAGLVLLLLYWMLCYILNPSDPYSLSGWFGTAVDKKILGEIHMYKGEGIYFDPEGIMSTIPAIVQVIFGYLVGDYIQKKSSQSETRPTGTSPSAPILASVQSVGQGKFFEMVSGLFVIGVALLVTGYSWDMVFPINKKIWTSSYTIYTSGLAIITLATMIYMIEIKNARGWLSRFFDVFGKNPLFIFVLSGFLPRVLALIRIPDSIDENGKRIFTSPFGWFYENVCKPIPGNPEIGSLIYAICMIIFFWAICYWLDRRKIYIKV
jgi:predicted acyltransferase